MNKKRKWRGREKRGGGGGRTGGGREEREKVRSRGEESGEGRVK